MAMKIEFAEHCIIELHRSARLAVWPIKTITSFQASEGKSFSFATDVPLTKVRMPTRPRLTTGFASGPASVSGAHGRYTKLKLAMPKRSSLLLSGIATLLSCVGGAAHAKDVDTHASAFVRGNNPAVTKLSAQASARIISLDEARPRVRFSASGLPVGLAIDSQTGVIGGIFDREANRNDGAPFIVTVNIALGNAASGASTIKLHIENRPPLAIDDMLPLWKKPIQINVLANDTDADGDRLVLTDAGALYGTVAFMADGLIVYGPNPGDVRADTINYTISDGHGGVAFGKVDLVVK
jgi:hypothetical protein